VQVEKVEEKTFMLAFGGTIIVRGNEGSIIIKSWDREQVHLKMTKRAWGRNRREAERLLEEIEVRIQETRNRLNIKEMERYREDNFNFSDLFDGEFWREKGRRSGSVDFELTVPREVQLRLRTDEGDIELSGTKGELTIDVDEGEVNVEDVVSDNVQINVDEGDIYLFKVDDGGDGLWKIDSDEGAIFIEDGRLKEIDASSDEGEIVLRAVHSYRFWLATDEGDIETDFYPEEGGSYRMETDEGDVDISIPENANLEVKLQTYEGRIDSDFDLPIRERGDGEVMVGVLGRREGTLRAFTDEGDIILKVLK